MTAIKKIIKFNKKLSHEKSKSNLEFKLKLREAKSFWIFQLITGICTRRKISIPNIKWEDKSIFRKSFLVIRKMTTPTPKITALYFVIHAKENIRIEMYQ